MQYGGDYNSAPGAAAPFYNNQQPYYPQVQIPSSNSNPIDAIHQAPPPYASAPPFAAHNYTPPPASSVDYSTSYNHGSSSYPQFPQNPDPLPTAPSFQQPQPSYPFPQFEAQGQHQSSPQPQPSAYSSSYDQSPPPPSNYVPNVMPNPRPVSISSNYSPAYPSPHSTQFNSYPYESSFDNSVKLDGYIDRNLGRSRSDVGSELYGKKTGGGYNDYMNDGIYGSNEGVYAYKGSREPYGARGTAPKSSTWSGFDDFGRPIGNSSSSSVGREAPMNSGLKVVRAVPKEDTQQDVKSGVQKFRVKLLAESAGQSTMDVLCQVGLDGIRMLDPSTSRILRIYLIDSITRCEAFDSTTFAFWSKTSVDNEPKRIRLQSNRYTTSTILDTVTATMVQFKEMKGRNQPSESPKVAEQSTEKKRGFGDWMNMIKPVNEEKDHWVPDEAVTKCTGCGTDFNAFVRKHHCRNCGDIFCDKCTHGRTALTVEENAPVVRVCGRCMTEVSRRLSNSKDAASRSTGFQNHEDLAKKLQEEMERSCKVSSGSKSNVSSRRMKEVACPTCTVHLQVQVPSSGSETIECGVCQHPFLVSSH